MRSDWHDARGARERAGKRAVPTRAVAKSANARERTPVSREPEQTGERVPGERQRQACGTRMASATQRSRRSPQRRPTRWRGRDGCTWQETAIAAVRAAEPLHPLDAAHEGVDRLQHERIGCWRRERRARLRQFRGFGRWGGETL